MEWLLPVHKAAAQGQHLGMGTPPAVSYPGAQVFQVQMWRGCRASCRALGTRISVLGKVFIVE